ncbi:leucine-rich repeat receptor-like protein kinase PXC1 [Neltuma alba]|uniref:leucine-rich repeat receptor-like protein kinase PXC1 n=1 Tax=Neltuma alba TaxID=207710 RepID=UPI0010A30562|nr:leucine-rich repeat receptor-like protein kinase PXC1 [Prosopis alba]
MRTCDVAYETTFFRESEHFLLKALRAQLTAPVSNYTRLRILYLSHNDVSGEFPSGIASLKHLLRLDLSDNNIHGPIPNQLSSSVHLLTLRLQNNVLSGQVSDLSVPLVNLPDVNFTNNELYGSLPDGMLKKFGDRTFSGNEALCGSAPFPICSFTDSPSSASPLDATS